MLPTMEMIKDWRWWLLVTAIGALSFLLFFGVGCKKKEDVGALENQQSDYLIKKKEVVQRAVEAVKEVEEDEDSCSDYYIQMPGYAVTVLSNMIVASKLKDGLVMIETKDGTTYYSAHVIEKTVKCK